ncbi:UvrD-helicase domain-containing protein [Massilia timonae]|uniref:UvrD-helicase domain-containing protein n=1 Tax=Massilia timonae TaxID=47229 RepID=UPI00289A19E8|nr:UvrD-helicase domain-containing protein [Massilia timonae]
MTAVSMQLADHDARVAALSHHNRSLLVEAGAGSGKTAVLAGRVALLLANGVAPCNIAAVSFTELSAGELLGRVQSFVSKLAQGDVPVELAIALPDGVSEVQRAHLASALVHFDELTCTTIHGFCQGLIVPYPAEAGIDPGATVIDAAEADVLFEDLLDTWLRKMLDTEGGGTLAQVIAQSPEKGLALAREAAAQMRKCRDATCPPRQELSILRQAFADVAQAYADCLRGTGVRDEATEEAVQAFASMAQGCDAEDAAAYLFAEAAPAVWHKGKFRAWKNKVKWRASAKAVGKTLATANVDYDYLETHHQECCDAWMRLKECVAGLVLAASMDELRPLLARFAAAKRDAAMLDFDDLLYAARDLLREHDEVRRALAQRYRHVLVDEFQDTDPLQSEIFWRLCGDPAPGAPDDWRAATIRPGALFLVGDPKQAIYRFRGADIAAYTAARDAFRRADPDSVLDICTNFRSLAPILDYVNACFETPLNGEGQPGFTALQPGPNAACPDQCVVALDVETAGTNAEAHRDAEAEAAAELCASLIGGRMIKDRASGDPRPCRAGDIALLAPGSTDLWRYEGALEGRGIAVASQAGKGFFLRQEVQDMVALTRTLADPRDTLALGALLRGPLVGLTEEELLDVVWALPREEDARSLPRLTLHTDTALIEHLLLRQVLGSLQALRRIANGTAPSLLLAQAIDALNIRAILQQRHRGHAERALCNVDRFIDMSRAYAVRGLGAFATYVSEAWKDASRIPEGQADSQEDAVTLYTMHAAKGLEWPVVIPINTLTRVQPADGTFVERGSRVLHCRVLGMRPPGYAAAHDEEGIQLAHERLRLWYVAATRARELLVLPRHAEAPGEGVWAGLCDFGLASLPPLTLDPVAQAQARPVSAGVPQNTQNAAVFAAERERIAATRRTIEWRAPSRSELPDPVIAAAPAEIPALESLTEEEEVDRAPATVQGGAARGRVLHKLFEEVLTGEIGETLPELRARAAALISELGLEAATDPLSGLVPDELANCVVATLALPEVTALRPTLAPEFGAWHAEVGPGGEVVRAGVVDAISFDSTGNPDVVVDWKSDVAPTDATLAHYRAQVGSYLQMTGARRGLIVLATSGKTIWID